MSSVQREEGGKSRRRRRRPTAPVRSNPTSNRNFSRQSPQHIESEPSAYPTLVDSEAVSNSTGKLPANAADNSVLSFGSHLHTSKPSANLTGSARDEKTDEPPTFECCKARVERDFAIEKPSKEEKERMALMEIERERRGAERALNLSFQENLHGSIPPNERPSDAELRQLDSSLKKCTGFLRKIRFSGISADTASSLCSEAKALNLSRYISEVVTAVTETKLRLSDAEHVMQLCGELHRRYIDFAPNLTTALSSMIVGPSANGSTRDLSVRKAAMRLLVDMFVLGLLSDFNPVTSVLRQVMRGTKEGRDEALANLAILATFARAAARTLLPSASVTENKDSNSPTCKESSWENSVLPQSAKNNIYSALQSFCDTDVERLVKEVAEDLKAASFAVTRSAQVRGSADGETTRHYESTKLAYEKILSSVNVLADTLGRTGYETDRRTLTGFTARTDSHTNRDSSHVSVSFALNSSTSGLLPDQESGIPMQADSPFEGDLQRVFYTELLSLPITPLAKEDHPQTSPSSIEKSSNTGDRPDLKETAGVAHSSESAAHVKLPGRGSHETRKKSEKPLSVDKLISKLTTVEGRDDSDNFVRQFVLSTECSRNGLKRLAKALLSVSLQELNLLPSYSRIAATLQLLYPETITNISTALEEEFRFMVSKPDVDEKSLAMCTKSAQYVGEHVKFSLIGTTTAFELLSLCTRDFSGHRVDMACHLLETCGRFIYLSPASHIRMGNILETVWRLKSVKNLEARHNALVETAFFAVKLSPGTKAHRKKSRPPVHEYIRHLLYHRLDATNIRWILNQFLKLPWDERLEQYVIKKFIKIYRARFSTIPYVSALIGHIQRHKPILGIGIVDGLLESIRSGMEKNDGRESQRRIAEVYLLGEMYKSGIVEERVIYNVLYQLITLGHESSEHSLAKPGNLSNHRSEGEERYKGLQLPRVGEPFAVAPDPAGDFFRIRLACVTIECCGRVLVASNRRKLEVYWVFLDRYLFCKTHQAGQADRLPLHIDHIVGDVFEHVLQRPRRLGKENRLSHRIEPATLLSAHGRAKVKAEQQWPPIRTFSRSYSLEEALEAVLVVERSSSDSALISVPSRRIGSSNGSMVPDRSCIGVSTRNFGSRLSRDGPVNGENIKGNIRDGFVTTTRVQPNTHPQSLADDTSRNNRGGALSFQEELSATEYEEDDILSGDEVSGDEDSTDAGEDSDSGDDAESEVEDGNTEEQIENDGNEAPDDDEDEDDEDDVILDMQRHRPRTGDEEAFAKELAAFTAAAVHSARASSSRITKFDRMAIPMSLMTQKLEEERAAAAAQAASSVNDLSSEEENGSPQAKRHILDKRSVEFKMLVRKGGKSQLQGLQVPASSSLAVAAKESESADAARHEETKRLVLGSSIVLNDDSDGSGDDAPLTAQQHARDKEESIRQQRNADERELLATLFRSKPRR